MLLFFFNCGEGLCNKNIFFIFKHELWPGLPFVYASGLLSHSSYWDPQQPVCCNTQLHTVRPDYQPDQSQRPEDKQMIVQ